MEQQNKNVIKALANQTFDDNKPFGQTMSHILFPKNKRALLCMDCHYMLLLPPDADSTDDIKKLIELLSHLRYMESEHIIYVQHGDDGDYLLFDGCDDIKKHSVSQSYDIGSGYELKSDQGVYHVGFKNGYKILSQNVNIDFLAVEIKKYIEGRIFPTSAISKFIKHDYCSENDYNNLHVLKISRWSIIIALAIACLSPLFTLWLSNQWGITTINNTQYDTILKKIEKSTNTVDTCAWLVPDPIKSVHIKVDTHEQNSIKSVQIQQ